ncbi:MAG: hypothetical protein QNJ36_18820, partial [Calothrix sp. MO_167.B42]|nr:hypothetical protein [Calothrix sp. MO_167.B42]
STPPRELCQVNNEKKKFFSPHTSHTSHTPPTQQSWCGGLLGGRGQGRKIVKIPLQKGIQVPHLCMGCSSFPLHRNPCPFPSSLILGRAYYLLLITYAIH